MESCLLPVSSIVEQFRTVWENGEADTLELEARLGVYDTHTNKFSPSINPLCFKDAERSLDQCTFWTSVNDWHEEIDVFLPGGVRQRIIETPTSSTCGVVQHSVCKKRLASEFLLCTGPRASIGHDCGMDARVTLNKETPVKTQELVPCHPTHIRIKQRKTYEMAHWRWDLSRVWSGNTRLEAEQEQRNSAPTYELELELINPDELFKTHSTAYIAESFLLKLGSLVRIIAKDHDLGYTIA